MGAAAVAARLALLRRAQPTAPAEAELLAFHSTGGPFVVIWGLAGGAGASTLAYLLARRAARHSTVPVLLAELAAGGGLAAVAGAASPFGLRELAHAVDEGRPPQRPFVELGAGLRLVASAQPAEAATAPAGALERLLADATAAHGLVIVDAGQPAGSEADWLLGGADHVLFCLPATAAALRRCTLCVTAGLFRQAGGRSALVCTATQPRPRLQVRQLRRLADGQLDRLLLVPYLPRIAQGELDEPAFESTMTELGSMLRGRP